MMDRPEAVDLLEAEFTQLNLTHYRNIWDPSEVLRESCCNAISRAKDEVVDDARYAELAEAMRLTASRRRRPRPPRSPGFTPPTRR